MFKYSKNAHHINKRANYNNSNKILGHYQNHSKPRGFFKYNNITEAYLNLMFMLNHIMFV